MVYRPDELAAPMDWKAFNEAFAAHVIICPEQRPGLVCPDCDGWVVTGPIRNSADRDAIGRAISEHKARCPGYRPLSAEDLDSQ